MKTELMQRIHDIKGSLNVVMGFVRCLDARTLTDGGQKLYQACLVSLERVERHIERIHDIVSTENPPYVSDIPGNRTT